MLRQNIDLLTAGQVDVVESGFLTYQHVGRPADFVYSRYALHHLPDIWKGLALARIYDMFRPDGVFRLWDVVYNFEPSEAERRLKEWCSTGIVGAPNEAVSDGSGRWELEEHVREEHSTYTWALENLFTRTGILIEESGYSPDGVVAKYVLRRPQGRKVVEKEPFRTNHLTITNVRSTLDLCNEPRWTRSRS